MNAKLKGTTVTISWSYDSQTRQFPPFLLTVERGSYGPFLLQKQWQSGSSPTSTTEDLSHPAQPAPQPGTQVIYIVCLTYYVLGPNESGWTTETQCSDSNGVSVPGGGGNSGGGGGTVSTGGTSGCPQMAAPRVLPAVITGFNRDSLTYTIQVPWNYPQSPSSCGLLPPQYMTFSRFLNTDTNESTSEYTLNFASGSPGTSDYLNDPDDIPLNGGPNAPPWGDRKYVYQVCAIYGGNYLPPPLSCGDTSIWVPGDPPPAPVSVKLNWIPSAARISGMANVEVSWQQLKNTLATALTGRFQIYRLDGTGASGADKDGWIFVGDAAANATNFVDDSSPLPVSWNPQAPITYRVCAFTDGDFNSNAADPMIFATCAGKVSVRPLLVGAGSGGQRVRSSSLNNLLIRVPAPNGSATGGWIHIRPLVHKPSAANADAKPQ